MHVEELGQREDGCPKGHMAMLEPRRMEVHEGPRLATVIPLYNEAKHIEGLVNSLVAQTMNPTQHMVLLLDGGSTDGTLEIIKRVLEGLGPESPIVRLVENPLRTVAHARNLALQHLPASVEYVVELLGHADISDDHLEQRMLAWDRAEKLAQKPLAGVGCKVEGLNDTSSKRTMWIDAALSSPLGQSDGQFSMFDALEPTQVPAFVTHRKSSLEAVQGWDTSFLTSQDSDLSMRLLNQGYSLYRAPYPVVKMARRDTLFKWWKMGHRYGFWRTKVVLRHPRRIRAIEWLPWMGVVGSMILLWGNVALWWLGAAAYVGVLMVEGLRHSRRHPSLLLGLPLCLFILHASFSIGLIDGFVRRGRNASDR